MRSNDCAGGLSCHNVEVPGGWRCIYCHTFTPRPTAQDHADESES